MEDIDQEKSNLFIDGVRGLALDLDMPVEHICALLLLIAEKFWVTNKKPPFIEFMQNCEQYLEGRDFD